MDVRTKRWKKFLQVNDSTKTIIILSYDAKLTFLYDSEFVYIQKFYYYVTYFTELFKNKNTQLYSSTFSLVNEICLMKKQYSKTSPIDLTIEQVVPKSGKVDCRSI